MKNHKIFFSQNISRKRMWFTRFLVFLTLIMGLSVIYYFLDPQHQLHQTEKQIQTIENQKEIEQVSILERKILKLKEINDKNIFDAETKENFNKMSQLYSELKTEIENQINFHLYLTTLEAEIKEAETQCQQSHLKIEEKHILTEKKLNKEKELMAVKAKNNLFSEKEEIKNHVLTGIINKLKDVNLTTNENQNLTKDKERFEKKITEIETEIQKMNFQIQLRLQMQSLENEITQTENETLKKLLIATQEHLKTQIVAFN